MAKYIYNYKDWTQFTWKDKEINTEFGEVHNTKLNSFSWE